MLNWDTPGLFDVFQAHDTKNPEAENVVAVIMAPGAPLPGKAVVPNQFAERCRGSYIPSDYLDTLNGIDNSSGAGALKQFVRGQESELFNDRIAYVTANDVFEEIERSKQFQCRIRTMMKHAAACMVGFAKAAKTRTGDERLPWAAPLELELAGGIPSEAAKEVEDYRNRLNYRDRADLMSGRLPFDVKVSCGATDGSDCSKPTLGQHLLRVENLYCKDSGWNTQDEKWYDNWKDQLFYAVSATHSPKGLPPSTPCTNCLSVNSGSRYAAVLLFAGSPLATQQRWTLSNKKDAAQFLEGDNLESLSELPGVGVYASGNLQSTTNESIVCIDNAMLVTDDNGDDPCDLPKEKDPCLGLS